MKGRRPTRLADINLALVGLGLSGGIFGLTCRPLGQIGLVPLSLSMCEVIAFIVVQSQTKLALVADKDSQTISPKSEGIRELNPTGETMLLK